MTGGYAEEKKEKVEKGPRRSIHIWWLLSKISGNYSGAPHLIPFEPSRIAQVCFKVPNEPIWSTLDQLQLGGYANLVLPPE
jgi:hypothetical protein